MYRLLFIIFFVSTFSYESSAQFPIWSRALHDPIISLIREGKINLLIDSLIKNTGDSTLVYSSKYNGSIDDKDVILINLKTRDTSYIILQQPRVTLIDTPINYLQTVFEPVVEETFINKCSREITHRTFNTRNVLYAYDDNIIMQFYYDKTIVKNRNAPGACFLIIKPMNEKNRNNIAELKLKLEVKNDVPVPYENVDSFAYKYNNLRKIARALSLGDYEMLKGRRILDHNILKHYNADSVFYGKVSLNDGLEYWLVYRNNGKIIEYIAIEYPLHKKEILDNWESIETMFLRVNQHIRQLEPTTIENKVANKLVTTGDKNIKLTVAIDDSIEYIKDHKIMVFSVLKSW